MKTIKKFLGIIAITVMIGFGFTSCDGGDGNGGGSGNRTIKITNNHTVAIKEVYIQGDFNNYQPYTKEVSITANGGKGSVTFTNAGSIGTLKVTFENNDEAYLSGGVTETTINVTVNSTGSFGISRD